MEAHYDTITYEYNGPEVPTAYRYRCKVEDAAGRIGLADAATKPLALGAALQDYRDGLEYS